MTVLTLSYTPEILLLKMAHTKQTARKSTGRKAPCKQFEFMFMLKYWKVIADTTYRYFFYLVEYKCFFLFDSPPPPPPPPEMPNFDLF